MAEADPQMADRTETPPAYANGARASRKRLALMVSVPLILILAALGYWFYSLGKVSTDNAYIRQDTVGVAAEVAGQIMDVRVKENQLVAKGALLFSIDPEPFEVKLRQSDASLAAAQSSVTALQNDEALSGADITAARSDIGFAEAQLRRQEALWARGFTTRADLDAARHAVEQARADLQAARARATEASAKLARGAAVPGENAQIASARAQREQSELDLRRTQVRAPIAGRIAQSDRLQKGQMAITGLPMVTIVDEDSSYIEANFKETQLTDMRVGQPAEIEIDAYPDLVLKGHVLSIGAGTGSEFSVLPAQNATGNWVKVTQRVPVRIAIDEKSPRRLIAGLSAHVTVFTDKAPVKQGR